MSKHVLLVLLVVAACKGKDKDKAAAGGGEDCKAVGAAVAKMYADQAQAASSTPERDHATKMGPLAAARLERHCTEDKWSADAIACAKAGDFTKCNDKLTPAQMDKLKATAQPINANEGLGLPPSDVGSGAAAGSSEGSAGSGSN